MKTTQFISSALVALFVLLTISTMNAQYYQKTSYNSNAKKFQERVEAAITIMEYAGYTFADYDLAQLKEGKSYIGNRKCYGNREYIVMAVCETGIKDIGLYIRDHKYRLVTTDKFVDNNGFTFTKYVMNYTSNIKITAKNVDSYSTYKPYNVAILVGYK